MNYYKEITQKIDQYYLHLKETSPFFRSIFSGEMRPEYFQQYLVNIKFALAATVVHCAIGAKVADKEGNAKLKKFFLHKIKEEVGHDMWAASDHDELRKKFGLADIKDEMSPAMASVIDANEKMVSQNPGIYLIYMLFGEYFTVVAGSECVNALVERSKFPANTLSVVQKHAELDQEHVHEWQTELGNLGVDFESIRDQVFSFLDETMQRYTHFWEQIMREATA